ncbi:MAG: hypothetical protein KME35_24275 [Aphanocapsa sp. GSE-SYN-MK-11-07L]|jgi:hypothetical protein|nr:hypothetical protein [Aphanocapsa sp. GSE-SYN-MK-11-07L]
MSYYDLICEQDQTHREVQGQIAEEWREWGASDGISGDAPVFPECSDYMAGFEPANREYLKRLEAGQTYGPGRLCGCGLKTVQDCHCHDEIF